MTWNVFILIISSINFDFIVNKDVCHLYSEDLLCTMLLEHSTAQVFIGVILSFQVSHRNLLHF